MFQIWGWWPPSVSSQCGLITILVAGIILTTCKYFRERVYICLLPFPQQKANQEMKTEPGDWGMGGCPLPTVTVYAVRRHAEACSEDFLIAKGGHLRLVVSQGTRWITDTKEGNKSPGWDKTTRNNKKLQLRTEDSMQTIVFNSSWTEEYKCFNNNFLKTYSFIFYLAEPSLTCSAWELQSALWHVGSFARGLWTLSHSMWDLVPCCGI